MQRTVNVKIETDQDPRYCTTECRFNHNCVCRLYWRKLEPVRGGGGLFNRCKECLDAEVNEVKYQGPFR